MTKKIQIQSVKDASNPKPWYEVNLENGPPEITDDSDGETDFNASEATVEAVGDINPDAPVTDCIYAVTVDGRYICYPKGRDLFDDEISLRAHLAWYDSDIDEFTAIEFVDHNYGDSAHS